MEKKSQPEPNFFAVLPMKVLVDKTISVSAKLLFACILSLTRRDGFCFAPNTYMAQLLNFSVNTISRLLGELEEKNYIKRSTKRGLSKNVIGTERKIFILIDTSQWGILGDSDVFGGGIPKNGVSDIPKNGESSFKEKEKSNANAYFFRNLKEFFIKRVFDLKGISYVFSGGRDGNAIKQFLARKIRPDHAKLIDFYLKSEKAEHNLSISAALSADTINQFNLKFNRETEVSRIWKSLN